MSAVLAGTAQGLAQGDTSVTFRQDTSAKPKGLTDANGGYRFMGWFRETGVNVNRIDADNAWFNGKTDADAVKAGKQVQKNEAHEKTSTYTADNAKGAKPLRATTCLLLRTRRRCCSITSRARRSRGRAALRMTSRRTGIAMVLV